MSETSVDQDVRFGWTPEHEEILVQLRRKTFDLDSFFMESKVDGVAFHFEARNHSDGRKTLFHYALIFENLPFFRFLCFMRLYCLHASINVNEETIIHLACAKWSLVWLETIHHFVSPIVWKHLLKRPTKNGKLPLHIAAFKGNSDMVRYLVKQGADLQVALKTTNSEQGRSFLSRFTSPFMLTAFDKNKSPFVYQKQSANWNCWLMMMIKWIKINAWMNDELNVNKCCFFS